MQSFPILNFPVQWMIVEQRESAEWKNMCGEIKETSEWINDT